MISLGSPFTHSCLSLRNQGGCCETERSKQAVMTTTTYSLRSCIRGYHAYKEILDGAIGEVLDCEVSSLSCSRKEGIKSANAGRPGPCDPRSDGGLQRPIKATTLISRKITLSCFFFLIFLQYSTSQITRTILMLLLLNVCRTKKEEKRL